MKECRPEKEIDKKLLEYKSNNLRAFTVEMRVPKGTPTPSGSSNPSNSPSSTSDGHIARAVRAMKTFIEIQVPGITEIIPTFENNGLTIGRYRLSQNSQ